MVWVLSKLVSDMRLGPNMSILEYMNKYKLNLNYAQINTMGFNKSGKEINLKLSS